MPDLYSSTELEDLPPIDQAKKSIGYALMRIRENPQIYYHMGFGTQAFSLLTEAYATLRSEPVADVRKRYLPEKTNEKIDTVIVRELRTLLEDSQIHIERGTPKGHVLFELFEKLQEILRKPS